MSDPGFSRAPTQPDRSTVPVPGGHRREPGDSAAPAHVLVLQQLAGNRAVSALLSRRRYPAAVQRQGPEHPEGSPENPIDLDAWAAKNPEGSPENPIDLDAWAAKNPEGSPGNPIELDRPSATEGAVSQGASGSAQQSSPGTVARLPTPYALKAVWKSIQRTGSQYPRALQLIFLAWARCETGDEAAKNSRGQRGSSALNFNMMNAEGDMGETPPAHMAAWTSGVTDPESARKRFDPKLNGPLQTGTRSRGCQ